MFVRARGARVCGSAGRELKGSLGAKGLAEKTKWREGESRGAS